MFKWFSIRSLNSNSVEATRLGYHVNVSFLKAGIMANTSLRSLAGLA